MTDSTYHLAQLNIAIMKYPIDDPAMAGFVSRIDEINALAEGQEGCFSGWGEVRIDKA